MRDILIGMALGAQRGPLARLNGDAGHIANELSCLHMRPPAEAPDEGKQPQATLDDGDLSQRRFS